MPIAQEGMHSISTGNVQATMLKIDLSKYYDKVKWIYINIILIQMEMNLSKIGKWIMGCIQLKFSQY